ncbi:unnamed protein product [Ectocarpus sp. 13 AM-2016]
MPEARATTYWNSFIAVVVVAVVDVVVIVGDGVSFAVADKWKVGVLDEMVLRLKVQHVVEAQRHLQKEVLDKVQGSRSQHRAYARVGSVPEIVEGDYVLMAGVRRRGFTPKILITWRGPWRVVAAERPQVYGVQNIVSGEVRNVHVARLRFDADAALEITAELKETFQHAFAQDRGYVGGEDGPGFDVEVEWVRFRQRRQTWEKLS